jgi:hypothetical protein
VLHQGQKNPNQPYQLLFRVIFHSRLMEICFKTQMFFFLFPD